MSHMRNEDKNTRKMSKESENIGDLTTHYTHGVFNFNFVETRAFSFSKHTSIFYTKTQGKLTF